MYPASRRSTVYVVMGQDRAGQWYEVAQTTATRTEIDGSMTAKLKQIMVVAVQRDGVKMTAELLINGTNCEEAEKDNIIEHEALKEKEKVDVYLKPRMN